MPFAVIAYDKPDHTHVRRACQSAHKIYLDEHKGRLLLAAGAMLDDGGTDPLGSVLLLDTDERSEAEEFVARDPFSEAGLFESVQIVRWRKAFFNFERFVDLDS